MNIFNCLPHKLGIFFTETRADRSGDAGADWRITLEHKLIADWLQFYTKSAEKHNVTGSSFTAIFQTVHPIRSLGIKMDRCKLNQWQLENQLKKNLWWTTWLNPFNIKNKKCKFVYDNVNKTVSKKIFMWCFLVKLWLFMLHQLQLFFFLGSSLLKQSNVYIHSTYYIRMFSVGLRILRTKCWLKNKAFVIGNNFISCTLTAFINVTRRTRLYAMNRYIFNRFVPCHEKKLTSLQSFSSSINAAC